MAREKTEYQKAAVTDVTVLGDFVYPTFLNEPDTEFYPLGEFKVRLALDEAEAKPYREMIDGLQQKGLAIGKAAKQTQALQDKLADLPYQPEVSRETGEKTGRTMFTFKQKHKVQKRDGKLIEFSVGVFDSQGEPIPEDVQVWAGTRGKVSFLAEPFCTALGAGVTLRLRGVQVVELKSRGARSASDLGFDATEGYTAPEAPAESEDEPMPV